MILALPIGPPPSLPHPTLALQIVTAGDAFANFIDPAAPQPSVLKDRLIALVPSAAGLQVMAVEQLRVLCERTLPALSYGLQRLPLEFGLYVGTHAAEQNAWRPKMGKCLLMRVTTRPLALNFPRRFGAIRLPACICILDACCSALQHGHCCPHAAAANDE